MKQCIDKESEKNYVLSNISNIRTNPQGYKSIWKRIGKCCDSNPDLMKHSKCNGSFHTNSISYCTKDQQCDIPNMTCGPQKNMICTGVKGNRKWTYRL